MQPSFTPATVGAPPRSVGGLLADSVRRPGGRAVTSLLTFVLVIAGVGMLAYPTITDLLGGNKQRQLAGQLDSPTIQQGYLDHRIAVGDALTRLIIPKLHVNVMVVQGVTEQALTAGAGHYPTTPLPCERGNVAIAGHRTTYGRPFNQLNRMAPGDLVILVTPFKRCTYRAVEAFDGLPNPHAVDPYDIAVVGQQGALGRGHWLTLTTCDPPGSAARRLILRLSLVSVQLLRAQPGTKPAPGGSATAHPAASHPAKGVKR